MRSDDLGEAAGVVQVPRLIARLPALLTHSRSRGAPVVVLPGYGFNDASTAPLRAYLRFLRYRVTGWGLGANHGRVGEVIGPVARLLEAQVAEHRRPIALVGQSLGGYVAREVARQHPELVSQVITLGTPIFARTSSAPICCRVTALSSDADRVVPPSRSQANDAATTNVAVSSTHFTMGIDPDVWRIVADRLAEEGSTRPVRPPR